MNKAISSQYVTNPIGFSHLMLFRNDLFSFIRFQNFFICTFSDHFIFSIFLQRHILKLSKYFRSNFLSVQASEPYKAMLQT